MLKYLIIREDKSMTTANKITILRVFLIPIMILFIYLNNLGTINMFGLYAMNVNQFIFTILFIVASLTDFLDGYIARKYNQVTTFGKFVDPIADKVLVITVMLYLMQLDPTRVALWGIMIVIVREFMVTGIRLLAVDKGSVIAASPFGKIKTVTTMIALVFLLFTYSISINESTFVFYLGNILWYLTVLFTLLSGLDYLFKNRQIVFESI